MGRYGGVIRDRPDSSPGGALVINGIFGNSVSLFDRVDGEFRADDFAVSIAAGA